MNDKEIKAFFILKAHKGPVNCLSISDDNRFLLSSSSQFVDNYNRITFTDNSICLWDIKKGKLIKKWKAHDFDANDSGKISVDFLSNDLAISSGPDCRINIWDLKVFKVKLSIETYDNKIECMRLFKSKSLVVTGGNHLDKTVRVWSLKNENCINLFTGHQWTVDSVDMSFDGTKVASTSSLFDHKPIVIWNRKTGKPLIKFGSINMRVVLVKFLTNKYVISSSLDRIIRIWNISTGKIIHAFMGQQGYPLCLKLFQNKNMIASGSSSNFKKGDNNIYFWDIQRRKLKNRICNHNTGVNCIDMTNDDRIIITGCLDGNIYIWKNQGLKL